MTMHNDDTQHVNPLLPIPGAQKSADKRATQLLEPQEESEYEPSFQTVIDLRRVVLRFANTGEEIQINEPHEALIGRRDPAMPERVAVDLSDYAGYRMGISRRHASILRSADGQLVIVDLGSSNGTFVNEVRLLPHIQHPLHDGDYLRLGNLVMQVDAKMAYRREIVDHRSARTKDAMAR